ncbi:acetyl/propionyl/methylcrotonyl-CoA carboxylase subunit alpha [Legionella londiniensis]|uniref:Biotin carboxylase n=1 Tax=Legionella londiniensis TaxID=45068 RepID=A0A0W0VS86_9GAMM|nr:acetyl-CoA carboxylase biotin carboxylase subunit [Legionella londiniensis]KTD22943.1 acyl CoA carboxylase subunit alpha [Legionella londiniensis]STX92949.1 acyl CoA carboxylase subunit alpha [Legionella londiniensis]
MFNKILIANRGEIACRIIKTAKRLGIVTAAVYSTADRTSLHVLQADEAYCIGGPASSDSYLNIKAIIAKAIEAKAEAIHPGYGFLSENPSFARACIDAGIIFIGPGVDAIEAMASKQTAKRLLEKTNVPLTPGYHGSQQSEELLLEEAKKIGFPVLLKAAAGGGGRGMRAVFAESEFQEALKGAAREAKASFADETMLIEKLINNPRHIEVQLMADSHGQVVHLFERDCSLQRRHQKIIEEAPAPGISESLREKLAAAAIEVAKTIHYLGAGTVEFLVDDNEQFYFMEMNTRLQVEHPVTEMITGLDLVEWQLRIAAGEPLSCRQEEVNCNGHAVECRIYAEDPSQGFMPSTGDIRFLKEPEAFGVRIDTGVRQGSSVSMHYDPMIAKLITWGKDRDEAIWRLKHALKQYYVGGVKTNIPFLQSIIQHPKFSSANIRTDFLDQEKITLPAIDQERLVLMASVTDYLNMTSLQAAGLEKDTFAWQMHLKSEWPVKYRIENNLFTVRILPITPARMGLIIDSKKFELEANLIKNRLHVDDGKRTYDIITECLGDDFIFYTDAGPVKVSRYQWDQQDLNSTSIEAQLTAPMPATVVAVLKNKGDKIKAGDRLMVLEAMKMEHTIYAPKDGLLLDIYYDVGSQVREGAELVAMESEPS